MSTLRVANVVFESTGNNRVQYLGSNSIALVVGGIASLTANTTQLVSNVGLTLQVATNSWALQCNTNANNSSGIWMEAGGAGQLALRDNNANLATIQTSGGALSLSGNVTISGTITDSTATLRPLVPMTSVTLTTQSTVEFTGIPSWVKKITVIFYGVSLSGTDQPLIQLGTSGGFVTSGYQSYNSDAGRTSTAGFIGPGGSAGDSRYGLFQLALLDGVGAWVCTAICSSSTSNEQRTVGNVNLAAALTQLRLTRTGTNTFDAGFINVIYE